MKKETVPGQVADATPWTAALEGAGDIWTARVVGHVSSVPAEYAFYLMRGAERVASRWYAAEPSAEFPRPTVPGSYHVKAFVRGGALTTTEVRQSALVVEAGLPLHDLKQWKQPVFEHRIKDGWAASLMKGPLRGGIHRFVEENGSSIDVRLDGVDRLQPGGVVLVCLGGAVPKRTVRSAPFFSGLGVAGNLGLPVLAIADPSIALSQTLALGWYAGHEKLPDLPQRIAALLDSFASLYGVRFVVFGGSGGGFATMSVLGWLRTPAKAVVWNPQTSIGRYYVSAVHKYLDDAFPSTAGPATDPVERRLAATGIGHDLVAAPGPQRHPVLYLQNQSDEFHVERHARPFMRARNVRKVSGAVHSGDDGLALWFGNWGQGHAVPPSSMLLSVLRQLASGQEPLALALTLDKEAPDGKALAA